MQDQLLSSSLVLKLLRRGGGGTPEGGISAGYYGLNANMSFTFQPIKNLPALPT